jgi:hypothetical protein
MQFLKINPALYLNKRLDFVVSEQTEKVFFENFLTTRSLPTSNNRNADENVALLYLPTSREKHPASIQPPPRMQRHTTQRAFLFPAIHLPEEHPTMFITSQHQLAMGGGGDEHPRSVGFGSERDDASWLVRRVVRLAA